MNNQPDDAPLRAAFNELAASDRKDAPAFDAVLSRPVSHTRSLGASVAIRLAAASVLSAAGVMTYQLARPRDARLVVPNEIVALMAWQPTTDVLLRSPSWDVTRTTLDLHSSILDSPPASDSSSGEDK